MNSSSSTSSSTDPAKNLRINTEYVKDLTFKIPYSPEIFLSNFTQQPEVIVSVNVNAQQIHKEDTRFEVVVILNCTSKTKLNDIEPVVLFEIQLQYGAIVTLPSLEMHNLQEQLMIHAPELLFPEIRNIIINLTRSSNLPPVLLQRIDFAGLWREKVAAKPQQS